MTDSDLIPYATVEVSLRCRMQIPGTIIQVEKLIELAGIALRPMLMNAIKENEADIQYKVMAPKSSDKFRIAMRDSYRRQIGPISDE